MSDSETPRSALPRAPGPLPRLFVEPRTAGPATPGSVSGAARLLRAAWDHGVRGFDVAGSPHPPVAATCLAEAFPEATDELVVIVPHRAARAPAGGGGRRSPPPNLGEPLLLGGARFPFPEGWVKRVTQLEQIDVERLGPAGGLSENDARTATKEPPATAVPVGPLVLAGSARRLAAEADRWPDALVAFDYSLLDRGPEMELLPGLGPRGIARNVFAGGLLDGSRWATEPPTSSGGPTSLRDLSRAYDAVLQLGFLTAGRKRTLAQAAILYVLAHPSVRAAVVPLPSAGRMAEVLAPARAAPLSPAEMEGVARLGARQR